MNRAHCSICFSGPAGPESVGPDGDGAACLKTSVLFQSSRRMLDGEDIQTKYQRDVGPGASVGHNRKHHLSTYLEEQ